MAQNASFPDWDNVLTPTKAEPSQVPVAVWICVALGSYGMVIILLLIIRQCVVAKGLCGECRFNCCDGSCTKWCAEACQASCDCKSPSVTGCLDAICPQRKNVNLADAVMCTCFYEQCGCCVDSNGNACQCGDMTFNVGYGELVMCGCCYDNPDCYGGGEGCNCGDCNCTPGCECDNINCLCFECKLNTPPSGR